MEKANALLFQERHNANATLATWELLAKTVIQPKAITPMAREDAPTTLASPTPANKPTRPSAKKQQLEKPNASAIQATTMMEREAAPKTHASPILVQHKTKLVETRMAKRNAIHPLATTTTPAPLTHSKQGNANTPNSRTIRPVQQHYVRSNRLV